MNKIIQLTLLMTALTIGSLSAQYGCGVAIPVTDGYTASSIITPGNGGPEDWVTSVTSCGGSSTYYTSTDAYVFSYITGGTAGEAITFTINPNVEYMTMGVFSSCTGTTLGGCLSEVGNLNATGELTVCAADLLAATTYYIVVSRWDNLEILDFDVVNVRISDSADIPSDECATAGAINLSQPFFGSTSCNYTPSSSSPSGCGTIENDSWMEFVAGATEVEIDYLVENCKKADGVQLSVFDGSCNSLSFLTGGCVNPALGAGTWNFSGMTVGNTYYIRIDGYAGDICTYSFDPVAGVAVIPPNDECADAITLTCGAAAQTGDIVIAEDTDAPNGCPSGSVEQEGIWFTFTGNGSDYTINTTGSDFETDLNVYSATGTAATFCSNLTCVAEYAGSAQEASLTVSTTNGTTYYVYLDGKSGAIGNYSIEMTCAVAPSCDAEAGSWN